MSHFWKILGFYFWGSPGYDVPMNTRTPSSSNTAWPLWFRLMGSVWFAAFLLALLTVILMASTSLESALGTPSAQRLVYQTRWFDAFLALMGLNIAASTVLRWPFKRKHTGFIVTHIGILILLAGSLVTRLTGVEGQMLLFENERSNEIAASSLEVLIPRGRAHETHPLESLRKNRPFAVLEDGSELVYRGFKENAALETAIEDGGSEPNPAIQVRVSSELTGFSESFWLVLRDPSNPDSFVQPMGPALLHLHQGDPPAPKPEPAKDADTRPRLLFHKEGKTLAEIVLDPLPKAPVPVGETGYRLQNVQYWPDARVGENNKLVTISDQPNNPAVEAELISPEGHSVRVVRFTFFPDFESMHSKPGEKRPDFDVELKAGQAKPATPAMPTLSFYSGASSWQYLFQSPKGSRQQGVIAQGQTYPAGWMDFKFTVEKLIDRARIRRTVRHVSGKNGGPAVWLSVRKDGRELSEGWLTLSTRLIGANGQPLPMVLRQRMLPVPFELRLKDFRKVDYPGTTRAASFESDVTLEDASEGFSLTRTIKMNKPLDYKGFRIFQSSFIEDTGHGEASVFTVAKNPGIPLIYTGCVILFIGMYVTFFIPSLSSLWVYKH